ncbi:hypothetical protein EJ04DRAFT_7739 [Polyplosphaeria fusca]|uniref:Uncharacterized protein n=1 Tax=Polyplosphaeria fusca TaxID=682080 RepID=A0A9P4R8U8_9PLEO|nr:hypothetical protein EJ04DRAFT_7739 [Polyplosphaeria fusca]
MASTSTPIPILLCGTIVSHQEATSEIVQPDFEVIKICASIEESRTYATALLTAPEYPVAMDGTTYRKPAIVIMGGGFSNDDFHSIFDEVDGVKSVPWIRPAVMRPGGIKPTAPYASEVVAKKVRKCLDAHAEDIKEGKGAGEIWWM